MSSEADKTNRGENKEPKYTMPVSDSVYLSLCSGDRADSDSRYRRSIDVQVRLI